MAKKEQLDPELMGAPQVVIQLGKLVSEAGASFGERPYRVWDQWLTYAHVVLEAGLGPFRNGTPFDPEAIPNEEKRLRDYFDAPHGNFNHLIKSFRNAFTLWYSWSAVNAGDTLGMVYMLYMHPSEGSGQFFTPWDVCLMMAEMNLGGSEGVTRAVFERIREAIARLKEADELQGILAESLMLTAAITVGSARRTADMEYIMTRLIPLITPYYEPVSIYDPACGSCTMLLAAASMFPLFANRMALVQYFGQDIDHTCVMMGTLNIMAYGLNGWGAASVVADLLAAEQDEAGPVMERAPEPPMALLAGEIRGAVGAPVQQMAFDFEVR